MSVTSNRNCDFCGRLMIGVEYKVMNEQEFNSHNHMTHYMIPDHPNMSRGPHPSPSKDLCFNCYYKIKALAE